MDDVLDIGEVARRTGLSLRALRFYEARGLVAPLRTAGGRRVYGRGELARLTAVTALKRAGFSLSRIAELIGGRTPDLGRVVAARLSAVEAEAAALADTRRALLQVQSRIDRGEPIDVATLCSLIRYGDTIMHDEDWRAVVDQYFTPGEQREFREKMADVPAGFDQAAYSAKWRELGSRIEAALPLDPAGDQAQAFVDEWFALLKPFSQVATPAMWQGTAKMYADMPNWKANPDMGFGHEVWQLIQAATAARRAAGGTVDGPAWMPAGGETRA
jgi:DNA-binding transcriptional MerR regulator